MADVETHTEIFFLPISCSLKCSKCYEIYESTGKHYE